MSLNNDNAPIQDWTLGNPEKLDTEKLKGFSVEHALNCQKNRINTFGNMATILDKEEKNFIQKEKQFLALSQNFLKSLSKFRKDLCEEDDQGEEKLKGILNDISPKKEKQESEIVNLRSQMQELDKRKKENSLTIRDAPQKLEMIAESININELYDSKVSSKDETSLIFKWFGKIFYSEKPENFSWSNFKKEYFKKNDGRPFILKIKSFDFNLMKLEDIEYTREVLNKEDDIMTKIEKKSENNSVNNLFEFLDLVEKVSTAKRAMEADEQMSIEIRRQYDNLTIELNTCHNEIEANKSKLSVLEQFQHSFEETDPFFAKAQALIQDKLEYQHSYAEYLDQSSNLMQKTVSKKPDVEYKKTTTEGNSRTRLL